MACRIRQTDVVALLWKSYMTLSCPRGSDVQRLILHRGTASLLPAQVSPVAQTLRGSSVHPSGEASADLLHLQGLEGSSQEVVSNPMPALAAV